MASASQSHYQKAQRNTPGHKIKARGSAHNMAGRFAKSLSFYEPDGLDSPVDALPTQVHFEQAKSILTKNNSPDVPFNYSVNPYRGCEHGCSYCFARPTHSYLDLSPGLDFESQLFVKQNAPQLLVKALANPNYRCEPFALGANTDCYQPIEKTYQITRRILEICLAFRQPVAIITKGALIDQDMDLLHQLNQHGLLTVAISVTTLDHGLKAIMEPRAASVQSRLSTIKALAERGIPVTVLMAPIIPKINDQEMESILKTVAPLGVKNAGYVMLRLPHELTELFSDWLQQHFPLKAQAVLNQMMDLHQGELYRSGFGVRQTGSGQYAQLIQQRFQLACGKLGINGERKLPANTEAFAVPQDLQPLLQPLPWQSSSNQSFSDQQLSLF